MNINRVCLSGNLTKDPDVRQTGGGTSVCKLRIAVNGRRKNSSTGDWEDKPNYFNVTVFGRQAESCGQYLSKGRGIILDGRLEWSEWEHEGQKRQSVDVIADNVQFMPDGGGGGGGNGHSRDTTSSSVPADTGNFEAAAVGVADDDIPF